MPDWFTSFPSDGCRPAPPSRVGALLLATVLVALGCGPDRNQERPVEAVYNQATGRLELLQYDVNGDGRVDTWSYMDAASVVRIELDADHDGRIDRWEHYGPGQQMNRVEISTKGNGKADRIEYYENGMLTRIDEDTSGDGRIDKWETYDGTRLTSVAFDTAQPGTPDRRLVYGADGSARLEVLP